MGIRKLVSGYPVIMPTTAELAKDLAALKVLFESELASKLERAVSEIKSEVRKQNEKSTDSFRQEFVDIKQSMDFMNTSFEELKQKCDSLLKDNAALKKENETLRERQTELVKNITQLEQYSRANNIEIRGVPVTKAEDCGLIVKAIADRVKCEILTSDIDTCHRVPLPNSNLDKNIIVRFISRDRRDDFLNKAKKARLFAHDLGFRTEAPRKVYFNDHLCPEYKKLFAAALRLKKEKSWSYLWTDRGIIKARKSDASTVFKITSEKDLSIFQ